MQYLTSHSFEECLLLPIRGLFLMTDKQLDTIFFPVFYQTVKFLKQAPVKWEVWDALYNNSI